MKRSFFLTVLIVMVVVSSVRADWPNYLGPNKNAISDEKGLLRSWPASGPKVLWQKDLGAGFGGVAVSKGRLYGTDQIVMITATSRREKGGRSAPAGGWDGRPDDGVDGVVLGMSVEDGSTLWTYKGWQSRIPIPNVAAIGDGRLFISGGYMAGSAMILVEKGGDKYVVDELYTTQDFGTHVHPPVIYKGHFYGHCTTNSRRDGMSCMSIDGELKWKTGRSPVFDKGGFILVDDLILSVDGTEGILYLIEPSPDGFKKLASVDLLDTKDCWGPLALSDGKLLIRDQKQMKCVAVR